MQEKTEQRLNIEQYIDLTSQLLDLPIAPEYRPGVVENLERIATIAQSISDFPLPETIEPALKFKP